MRKRKSLKERFRQWYVRHFIGPSPEVRRRGFASYASAHAGITSRTQPKGEEAGTISIPHEHMGTEKENKDKG